MSKMARKEGRLQQKQRKPPQSTTVLDTLPSMSGARVTWIVCRIGVTKTLRIQDFLKQIGSKGTGREFPFEGYRL